MTIDPHPVGTFRRWWRSVLAAPTPDDHAPQRVAVRARQPRFGTAVVADARITSARRGDRHEFTSNADAFVQIVRLAIVTDSFLAQTCYRAKVGCQIRRIPILPRVLHRLAVITGQISIDDPVVMQPGVYIPHGQVVIDGDTEIAPGVILMPFVTVGLRSGYDGGPSVGGRAAIGTGAKVLGPVRVGQRAQIGANAVVLTDVSDGATAVGVPARILS
ncbi:MAG: hypothetical protein WKF43_05630 [Acidimicrobiales bacterium]